MKYFPTILVFFWLFLSVLLKLLCNTARFCCAFLNHNYTFDIKKPLIMTLNLSLLDEPFRFMAMKVFSSALTVVSSQNYTVRSRFCFKWWFLKKLRVNIKFLQHVSVNFFVVLFLLRCEYQRTIVAHFFSMLRSLCIVFIIWN